MKKIMSIMLVMVLVVSLAACASEPAERATMDISGGQAVAETVEYSADSATEATPNGGTVEEAVRDAFTNLPDHIYKIGQEDFLKKVAAGDDMVIIDIRSAESYAEGHVQGAINLPWGGTAISDGLASIPQDKEVFIYCVSGQTAGQTVLIMNAAGINARSVNLGYKFGISTVEGYDELITETTVNEFGSETYPIDPEFQAAADAYYAGLADVSGTTYTNYKISEENLQAMIESDEDFFLLSARSADSYAEAHIEGAVNIPYGSDMLDNLAGVPMDKKVVVYCYSGQTAGQATAAMRLLGYDAVSLNGGMGVGSNEPIGWTNKGLPVVSKSAVESAVDTYFAELPDAANYKIGHADFVELVAAGTDATIIDIRSAESYAESHVKGAINLPWGGTAISDGLKYIPQGETVYIYCVSGQTAGQTVAIMNMAGIDAKSVNLGFKFGISTVDGVDAILETTENAVGTTEYEINPEIQAAADAYYAGLADVSGTTYTNYKISEENLQAMIEANEDFYLLSVRQAADYAEGHIEGAANIAWGADMIDGIKASVPMDKKVVVYCYSGQTAGQTVAAMRLLGYDAVSLNGGMGVGSNAPIGWTNKGLPVVSAGAVSTAVDTYFAELPDMANYKIGQADFVEMVAAGTDATIVDIRSASAYAESHVKGAINLPWGGTDIADGLKYLPQDETVYIYCVSGQTAGQTVAIMNMAGIDARSVNLGFKFGISTVDGVDAVLETTENAIGTTEYEIDPAVQAAADAYYAGLADVSGTTYTNYKISEDNLQAMIDADEDFYLLSIRSADDYAAGHIQGAANVPWGADMIDGIKASVPMDKKVVVTCYSGQTAGQTVAAMRLLGYDAVSLNGGMGVGSNAPIGWTNGDRPTTTVSYLEQGVMEYFTNLPDAANYKIGQEDFVDMVAAGTDATIIDIRSAEAYAESHVKGAINLPWGGTAIADGLASIPQGETVYIYCVSGQTAGQTVMIMNLAGIDAKSVNLGFKFGISTVDGVDAVLETEANTFGSETYPVELSVQAAADAYYAGLADVSGTTYTNYKISEDNLEAMINDSADFFLLSIRQAADYEAGHIEGAVNVPWGADMMTGILDTVPMDGKVVVYCYSGQTAGQATAAMRLLGYDAVSLNGGMGVGSNAPIGWSNAGKDVVQ